MLKSILLALDDSPSSAAAVDLGVQWAKSFNALLVGLGIVDVTAALALGGGYRGASFSYDNLYDDLITAARSNAKKVLEQFATRCTEANVSYKLLQDTGFPCEEILRESQRYDLVLFGHETHFQLETAFRPDETLWTILEREPKPVVVAPSKLEAGSSVLVAYDASPNADRALQAFLWSGLDLGEEVCVFSTDEVAAEAARRAERAVEYLRLHRIAAVANAVGPVNSVAQSILAEVRQRGARLLVMGAYGHSTLREFLFGSTTKAVLQQSTVPVLLCH